MPARAGKEQTKNKKPHRNGWDFLMLVTRDDTIFKFAPMLRNVFQICMDG
jgi:hypothetical protein